MSLYENPQSSESAAALTSGHPVDYGCKSVMVAPPPSAGILVSVI